MLHHLTSQNFYFFVKLQNLYKKVNFELTVNFAVELIRNIWKNKNSRVLIRKEIDKTISEYIYTDEIRVKQIIINLLSNSLNQ